MTLSASELDELLRGIHRLAPDRKLARNCLDGDLNAGRGLWRSLAEMGILGAPLPEDKGGSAILPGAQATIVEALARMVAPTPITMAFLAAYILSEGTSETERLARELGEGERIVGACLSASTGIRNTITVGKKNDGTGLLDGEISDVVDGGTIDRFVVFQGGRWWAFDSQAAGFARTVLPSIDATRTLASIRLERVPATDISGAHPDDVMALAWMFTAAESLGVAQAALDMASRYALERKQFGEQIGRFQAIKHKLADCLVATEGARSAIVGAGRSARNGIPDHRLARVAKLLASAAGTQAVGEAIQIHGAIGCTWEHDLHMLLRRAKYCQIVFQSDQEHLSVLAEELLQAAGDKTKPRARSSEGDFEQTESDRAFLAELRDWLDTHATKERRTLLRSRNLKALREWQGEMANAGWAGIHWPTRFGGRDASFTQQVLYHSELASRGLPPLVGNRGLSLIGPTLIVHGTPEQQTHLLEATRRADVLWASGLSEPGSGSDLASLRMRAVVDGDMLVVNGQKIWTSGAHHAEWLYTLVRTGGLVPKHDGITCVLIPLNSEGLTIRPIRRMTGEPEFNEIFFDDVRVPITNVMGKIDKGWGVARTTLAHEHMTNFLGAQLRQSFFVDRIIAQLAEREANQGFVSYGLRHRVAQAWVNTQLLRLHGLRNMTKIVEGKDPGAEGSILKLFGQEEERRLYELAVDVQGVQGLQSAGSIRGYLGARAATIGGGTSEIHRNKIAERVLGMPRDLWADD